MASQPLELILARNLVTGVSLAALVINPDGEIVFFNDAAGDLIGRRFEEVGRLRRDEWSSEFGPFDEFGQVVPTDDLPLTVALRKGLPATGRFHLCVQEKKLIEVDVAALPLATADGFKGALVVFWRAADSGPD